MRHLKILGLLAVAAAALLALAGSASATTLTSPTGTVVKLTTGSGATHKPGTQFHAVSEEKAVPGTSHVLLHNEALNIRCNSTIIFDLESQGAGVTAKGALDALVLNNCTDGWTVAVVKRGTLEIHWTSGYNGTLTSTGITIEATLHLGIFGTVECFYETKNTHLGTITGGNPATLHLEARIPLEPNSDPLCGGSEANWTGSYVTTSAFYVDQ